MNHEPETSVYAPASDETRRSRRRRDRRPRRAAVVGGTVGLIVVVGGGYGVAQSLTDDKDSGKRSDAAGASVQAVPEPAAPSAEPSAVPSAVTAPSASASPSGSASPSTTTAGTDRKPASGMSAKPGTAPATDAGKGKSADGGSAGGGKGNDSSRKAPAAGNAAGKTAGGPAQQVVEMVNAERAKNGCSPVTVNSKLQAAAQGHSDDMAARDYYAHSTPEGKGPGDRMTAAGYRWSTYGENIFKSPKDARTAMEGWMKSPGHRSNILNCAFKEIGVGINFSSNGPWWTQNFGASS